MVETLTINLQHVARGLGLPVQQIQAAVELLDEGNTVPFITRYRKDQTGGLDEEQIRRIQDRLAKMRLLRRAQADDPPFDRGPGQADREAGQADSRRPPPPSGSKTSTCPTSPRSRPSPRSPGRAAWRSSPRKSSTPRRPARTSTPGRPTSSARIAVSPARRTPCWEPGISWPSSSANGPTCARDSARSSNGPASSSPTRSRRQPRGCSRKSPRRRRRPPTSPRKPNRPEPEPAEAEPTEAEARE